jgi:hypothetical protein
MRSLLATAFAVLGVGMGATPALAATVRATPTIQGAGTVSAPGYACTSTNQNSSAVKNNCGQHVVVNDPAPWGVSTTLTATASDTPVNQWEFVRWTGCESVSGNQCTVGAGAGSAHNWAPRAVFRDATAPTITFGPSETYSGSQDRTVSLSFGYNEGVTTQCRVDSAAFQNCSSGLEYTGSEGDHTFDVQAVDASGNWSGTSSRLIKLVDTVIGPGPADGSLTNKRSATFGYSSVAGNAFECRLDDEAFATCPNASKTYANLADGRHTFQVRAVNGGFFDRIAAERTWRVDGTAPVTSLVPHAATPGEGVISALSTATFAFSVNELAVTECSLDGAAFTRCGSPKSYSGLRSGPHTFRVRAIDTAGNVGAATERHWVVAVPDTDNDGYNALADCNDRDATVNPGRPEILNNNVDENCDGKKEYDRDLDGSRADKDCDDNDPKRTPGKPEIPGNGIDDDCDGIDARAIMTLTLGANWQVYTDYTILSHVGIAGAPIGAKAVTVCKGRKCPKKKVTQMVKKPRQRLKGFGGKKLKPGTVLTVTVSHPRYHTATKKIKIRAGKRPVIS